MIIVSRRQQKAFPANMKQPRNERNPMAAKGRLARNERSKKAKSNNADSKKENGRRNRHRRRK